MLNEEKNSATTRYKVVVISCDQQWLRSSFNLNHMIDRNQHYTVNGVISRLPTVL